MTALLQVVGPDAPDIHARYAQHLDSPTIIAALERSGGIVTAAAKSLRISRDTLYERLKVDEAVRQALGSVREKNLDLAEGQLLRMIKEGDGPSVRFFLRTVGRHRGYSERLVVEATPEPAQRPRVDMSAALRALSPEELMALEGIVSKLEASARIEARDRASDDDPADLSDGDISGARSQHPTRSPRSRRLPLPTRSSRTRSRCTRATPPSRGRGRFTNVGKTLGGCA